MTKVVAAGDATWSDILDDVENNVEVVITKDGRAIARVIPAHAPRVPMTLEELRRSVLFVGDVETPVDEWDIER